MSTIKLEAYLEGLTLEQAREQARQTSNAAHMAVFVNVRAHRCPGTGEYIVYFAVSIWAGESVEALFVNGIEQTL